MKIAVVFLLVAVSGCSVFGFLLPPLDTITKTLGILKSGKPNDCLLKALKHSEELIIRVGDLLCTDSNSVTKEQVDGVLDSLSAAVDKVECTEATAALGVLKTLNSAATVKQLADGLKPILLNLWQALGFKDPVLAQTCPIIKNAAGPDCLPYIVGEQGTQLILDMNNKVCTGADTTAAAKDIGDILQKITCVFAGIPIPGTLNIDQIVAQLRATDGPLDPNSDLAKSLGEVIKLVCPLTDALKITTTPA